jgi:hypothetical protein
MMHFHFTEQVVADHGTALHDRASAYRLVETVPARSPWYRHIARRIRLPRELGALRPRAAVAQSTVPLAQH